MITTPFEVMELLQPLTVFSFVAFYDKR